MKVFRDLLREEIGRYIFSYASMAQCFAQYIGDLCKRVLAEVKKLRHVLGILDHGEYVQFVFLLQGIPNNEYPV